MTVNTDTEQSNSFLESDRQIRETETHALLLLAGLTIISLIPKDLESEKYLLAANLGFALYTAVKEIRRHQELGEELRAGLRTGLLLGARIFVSTALLVGKL